jgi:hypothetical protein
MKNAKILPFITLLFFLIFNKNFGQCTAAKDSEMAKYLELTKTQDAQGCSQCGMLAMYFCSAKYCVKSEDVDKVGRLIEACKQNIVNMGQPYCCPEYINKQPEWGSMAGGQTQANSFGNSNPLTNNNSNQAAGGFLNAVNPLTGDSSAINNFNKGYAEGEQIMDVANGVVNLLSGTSNANESQLNTGSVINALNSLAGDSSVMGNFNKGYAEGEQIMDVTNGVVDLFSGSSSGTNSSQSMGGAVNALNALTGGSTELDSFTSGYAQGEQIMDAAAGLIDLFGPSPEEKARQLRAENLRIENEKAAARARANKIQMVASRKALINKYPDGKTPLSYQIKDATEVYFFVYSYQPNTIDSNSTPIYISNVFSLAKYGDDTWPFKASLMEKIAKTYSGLDFILSGYYENKNTAEQQQKALVNEANSSGFTVNKITYSGTKSTSITVTTANNSNTDFWGNTIKKDDQQQNNNSTIEPEKPKSKVDFWGNPIKE